MKEKIFKTEVGKRISENMGKLPSIYEILELIAKGVSQAEIAVMYKVSRQSVSNALIKYKKNESI